MWWCHACSTHFTTSLDDEIERGKCGAIPVARCASARATVESFVESAFR